MKKYSLENGWEYEEIGFFKALYISTKHLNKAWKFQPILFEGSSEANKKAHDLVPGFDRGERMTEKPCVIFVHGIKGGHLRNQQNKKIWLRAIDLFSNRDTGLASPIEWEDGLQKGQGQK